MTSPVACLGLTLALCAWMPLGRACNCPPISVEEAFDAANSVVLVEFQNLAYIERPAESLDDPAIPGERVTAKVVKVWKGSKNVGDLALIENIFDPKHCPVKSWRNDPTWIVELSADGSTSYPVAANRWERWIVYGDGPEPWTLGGDCGRSTPLAYGANEVTSLDHLLAKHLTKVGSGRER